MVRGWRPRQGVDDEIRRGERIAQGIRAGDLVEAILRVAAPVEPDDVAFERDSRGSVCWGMSPVPRKQMVRPRREW